MSAQMDKPPKIGTEITVRISLTFQEAPDVHTLLAMTPVRERGKLVRMALEQYIAETRHPAGDIEQQIHAISTWLWSRSARTEMGVGVGVVDQFGLNRNVDTAKTSRFNGVSTFTPTHAAPALAGTIGRSDSAPEDVDASASSIRRWLQA
jgi:hypothetical protein